MSNIGYNKSPQRIKRDQEASLKTNDTIDYDKLSKFYELETAIVIDVIRSFQHPLVQKTNNINLIGAIICRPIYSSKNLSNEVYTIAYPLDANIRQYPVENESVVLGEWGVNSVIFYMPLGYLNSPNFNGSRSFNKPGNFGSSNDKEIESSFAPSFGVSPLLPNPGDTIIQSRFGSSIRLTNINPEKTGNYRPSILISNKLQNFVADPVDKKFGYLTENVNIDGSSLYLLNSDVPVNFVPNLFLNANKKELVVGNAYEQTTTYREKIVKSPPQFLDTDESSIIQQAEFNYPTSLSGDQAYLSSNRLIFVSKLNETLLFSKGQIGFFTDSKFSVDSKRGFDFSSPRSSYRIRSDSVFLNAPTIHLGWEGDVSEPALLGRSTMIWLMNFLEGLSEFIKKTGTYWEAADKAGQLKLPGLHQLYKNYADEIDKFVIGVNVGGQSPYLPQGQGSSGKDENNIIRRRLLSNKVFIGSNRNQYNVD